ncbi:hypothetical protein SSX86_004132 [Deinandra increscens subsp. villosa]|uniref:Uncharacterized protein n=1 Tax=Deinandra increscens subsp. villosa TaxID=3103831 RepID=A0AAP0DRK1_9ASTR
MALPVTAEDHSNTRTEEATTADLSFFSVLLRFELIVGFSDDSRSDLPGIRHTEIETTKRIRNGRLTRILRRKRRLAAPPVTGVFLPRQPGAPTEPVKNRGCSTVLLPDRVVRALDLKLESMGGDQSKLKSICIAQNRNIRDDL